jgi:hypothetical protein
VTPDGLIACLYGPVPGSRHDSYLLGQSDLKQQLCHIFKDGRQPYTVYADSANAQTEVIFGGFKNAIPGSPQANWNADMSRV